MGGAPRVWVLADERPGNANQAIGVAEALGCAFDLKAIRYSRLARLPNAFLGSSLAGIEAEAQTTLVPPWPEVVIGAGRRTAPVARWIKRQNAAALTVQMMWPGSAQGLDLVVVPAHDRIIGAGAASGHLLRTLGAPHRWTRARLDREAEAIAPHLRDLPKPRIACLIGGNSRHGRFESSDAHRLAEALDREAQARGGSLLMTTSRRTGKACEEVLARFRFARPVWLHCFGSASNALRPSLGNPYAGFLGAADQVVVTSDSVSMVSEACATGRPVFVFTFAGRLPRKQAHFHARLRDEGRTARLGEAWQGASPCPLVPQEEVAAAIWECLRRRAEAQPERAGAREALAQERRSA